MPVQARASKRLSWNGIFLSSLAMVTREAADCCLLPPDFDSCFFSILPHRPLVHCTVSLPQWLLHRLVPLRVHPPPSLSPVQVVDLGIPGFL